MLETGTLVDGKYKILSQIGQGGMSVVYLAMNEKANKQWAVKELRKEGVQNYELVKQGLIGEINLLKKLKHPNLPSIVDVIDWDGSLLIVMDYIEGRHLESIVKEYGAQKQEDVLEWGKQLCHVLAYLHSRKPPVIYRDMKPSNVMLKPEGRVMLIDFGAAREFKKHSGSDTTSLGTQGYAAPEQYGGQGQTDARTDIYCLGATLYHLLTGHNPGEPPYEMYPIRAWNQSLSSGLEEIILKCTQKNPDDRYQTCGELLYALEHYQELDMEYKKKQKIQWYGFLASVFITAVSGTAAVFFAASGHKLKTNTYEAYVAEAESLVTTDPKQCIEYYENAVNLHPGRGDAYEGLLHFFLWQNREPNKSNNLETACILSEQEDETIRKILGQSENRKKSNETYLKTNTEEYQAFAYHLGIAYFYSYNGIGNKAAARKWLEIAAGAEPGEGLKQREITRAKGLYKIAGYYESLGMRNQAGESMISYEAYWYDLSKMTDEESKDSNLVSRLLSYKEMTAQIVTHASDFKAAGISRQQMEETLKGISESLEEVDRLGTANAEYEQELKEQLLQNISLAKNMIRSTYSTGKGER